MPAARGVLHARLRRARVIVVTALALVTAGLSAAVARVIPGRDTAATRPVTIDPFTERLTAYPPVGAPEATTAPPVTVSGAS